MARFWSGAANGLVPGLLAGLILGFLLLAVVSPLIVKAETYENHSEEGFDGPSNARDVGTILGAIVIGSAYGVILSAIYGLTAKTSPARPVFRGLGFGLLAYFFVSLIPSLGFLPNPPGVEAKAAASVRQAWWLGIMLLEVTGLTAYFLIVSRRVFSSGLWNRLLGLSALAALMSIPFLLGLPNELSSVSIPSQLLFRFRVASLSTLLVFWLVLGALIGGFNSWGTGDYRA